MAARKLKKIAGAFVLVGVLFGIFAGAAAADVVWVATGGDDGNPGTEAEPFATIQKGIDEVSAGGTVYVGEGTYEERIEINKAVTVQSLEGRDYTFIDAQEGGTVVKVTAGGAVLDGFTVQDSGSPDILNYEFIGIAIGASECVIRNNTVRDNGFGIAIIAMFDNADGNLIENNIVEDNFIQDVYDTAGDVYGIFIDKHPLVPGLTATGNFLIGNYVSGSAKGIYLAEAASETHVEGNHVFENFRHGIQLYKSDYNTFEGNFIYNNGIQAGAPAIAYDQAAGVRIGGSRNNNFENNEIFNEEETGGLQVKGFRIFDGEDSPRIPKDNIINYNRIYGHAEGGSDFLYGIQNVGYHELAPVAVDARYNWWGDASGPFHATENPGGLGDRVSDNVLFEPWYIDEDLTDISYVPDVAVTTLEASGVGRTSATLRGELEKIEDIGGVEVSFFWREQGKSGEYTEAQVMTEEGAFSRGIENLKAGTRYDFRAEAAWTYGGESKTVKGQVKSFTTDDPAEPAPDDEDDDDAPAPPPPLPDPPAPPENFNASPAPHNFQEVNLSWEEAPGIAHYNIYASSGPGAANDEIGAQEAGGLRFTLISQLPSYSTGYTHSGLTSGVKYYYVITSVDAHGTESAVSSHIAWVIAGTNESGRLDPIPWGPARVTDRPLADSSSSCFIATSAYGSAFSAEVMSLRRFRDSFLFSSGAGRMFTDVYYRFSPALADAVGESRALRLVARLHLAPFVRAADLIIR